MLISDCVQQKDDACVQQKLMMNVFNTNCSKVYNTDDCVKQKLVKEVYNAGD